MLVGWKYVQSRRGVDLKLFSMKESDDSKKMKLFLRNRNSENCLIIKNLPEKEYLFKENNINSTFYYHTTDGYEEFLQVDIRLCEDKIDVVHERLPRQDEDLDQKLFLKLLNTILAIKPK